MGRSRPLAVLGSVAVAWLLAVPPARAAEARRFTGLTPGRFQVQTQRIPVRVVLVGFGDEVDTGEIADSLPATYKPVVRYPLFYGRTGRDLGLEYQFRYRFERRSNAFAAQLFAYLKSVGTPGPITAFQESYNEQGNGVPGQRRPVREVRGPILYIDAARTEKWLVDHDADAAANGYTLYFINWYGRPDFQFHVYTKTDEPDPDTGYNFGVQRAARKMISWGGTHSRNWFYDFSAGPESWGGSYDINDADLDGDGSADYRIPPVWEYDAAGYRAPERLSHDMGLLVRFVGIDLLFTTSPLYDPLVTAPEPGGRKVAHVAMLENEPGVSGLDWFHGAVAERQWRAFQPYYAWKVGVTDSDPADHGARKALAIFSGNSSAKDCWTPFGDTFAELFCYFDANLRRYIPKYGPRDYVGEIFSYSTTAESLGSMFGLLGFADDNWEDGAQTYEFVFASAGYRELGYGLSSTVIHEFGHHIGMSHPHDGFDSESGTDYDAAGETYFAWLGDETDTVMHYLSVSNGFGRHNQDNMYRWETAGYLNWANAVAGDLLASPEAPRAMTAVLLADRKARLARDAFDAWHYLEAATSAREAYVTLKQAADGIGVVSAALAESQRMAALGIGPRKDGCRPRYPKE
jgi:hypothetical protein